MRSIASLSPSHFDGTVWRVHWREVAPTDWSLSLRTSGRYHQGLDLFSSDQAFPALYTSLAPEIAIWEMVRRSAARNLAFLKNNVLSELTVKLNSVVDISNPTEFGLSHADLTGDDQSVCQELAVAALNQRYEGLLVPSAALPGLNLVLLPNHLSDLSGLTVVRSTELPLDANALEHVESEPPENW